jgi:hypothetical protein
MPGGCSGPTRLLTPVLLAQWDSEAQGDDWLDSRSRLMKEDAVSLVSDGG